jgi:hypothetical protein
MRLISHREPLAWREDRQRVEEMRRLRAAIAEAAAQAKDA